MVARKAVASISPETQVEVLSPICSAKNRGQSVLLSARYGSKAVVAPNIWVGVPASQAICEPI